MKTKSSGLTSCKHCPNSISASSWIQFWLVTVVPKYLSCEKSLVFSFGNKGVTVFCIFRVRLSRVKYLNEDYLLCYNYYACNIQEMFVLITGIYFAGLLRVFSWCKCNSKIARSRKKIVPRTRLFSQYFITSLQY